MLGCGIDVHIACNMNDIKKVNDVYFCRCSAYSGLHRGGDTNRKFVFFTALEIKDKLRRDILDLSMVFSFLVGFCMWPAVEYSMHAGLGHLYLRGKTTFSRQHTRHHAEKDWFAPTWQKVAAAVPVLAVTFVLCYFLVGFKHASALTFGFAFMYFIYELVHLRAHTHPPKGRYGRWVRRHHFAHHFQSPRKNHGVTTPIFDYVFGTHVDPGKVKVPERFALRWLINPATGDVWDYLADDYELKKTSVKTLKTQKDMKPDAQSAFESEPPVF